MIRRLIRFLARADILKSWNAGFELGKAFGLLNAGVERAIGHAEGYAAALQEMSEEEFEDETAPDEADDKMGRRKRLLH